MRTPLPSGRGSMFVRSVLALGLLAALPAVGLTAIGPAGPQIRPGEADSLAGLPLVTVRHPGPERDILAVFLTGDGGWGVADKGICRELAESGIPAVALNSFKYFWTRRSPEAAAADLERILKHYLESWDKKKAVLIGYSLGADVLPFMFNRLSAGVRERVGMIVLMGPSRLVEFEVHMADWLGRSPGKGAFQVIPEIRKIDGNVPILCIYGDDDHDQICTLLDPGRTRTVAIDSGHRFRRTYQPVAEAIIQSIDGQ